MNKNNNIVIYQSEDGKVHLDVVYNEETMWLSQQQLCELYQTSKSNVSEHIKHIFEDGELDKEVVVRNFRQVASSINSPSSYICLICSTTFVRDV